MNLSLPGKWLPGRDNWARCWVRNVIRICLVLITSSLAVAVPHFALLSGLVGGVSDTLQSLVLPPLLYVVDVLNKGKLPPISSPSAPNTKGRRVTGGVARAAAVGLSIGGMLFMLFATISNVKAVMAIGKEGA